VSAELLTVKSAAGKSGIFAQFRASYVRMRASWIENQDAKAWRGQRS